MSDAISEYLGAEISVPDKVNTSLARVTDATKSLVDVKKDNQVEDYEVARTNIKSIITDTMKLMPDLIQLTREAYSDKMYKAAAEFISTLADLNISLSDLNEVKETSGRSSKEIKTPTSDVPSKPINVFVGTTEDMLDQYTEANQA
jgi:hypothetical protein